MNWQEQENGGGDICEEAVTTVREGEEAESVRK